MSTNAYSEDKGTGGLGAKGNSEAAPKLRSGEQYPTWCRDIDIWLQRNGAHMVHSRKVDAKEWKVYDDQVQQWGDDELLDAMSAFSTAGLAAAKAAAAAAAAAASSSKKETEATTTTAVVSDPAAELEAKRRKHLTAMVQNSHRVYGVLFSALPDDLREQAESVQRGYAYGLWHWLEMKFQSVEQDNVGELLGRWSALRQEEEESYDSYRARVNTLYTLLKAAKETPSDAMRSHTLTDRLTARYKPVVLALKASGALKDATKIGWEDVTLMINRHEREEIRSADHSEGVASTARSAWANAAQGRAEQERERTTERREKAEPTSETRCYRCDKFGHFAWGCDKPYGYDKHAA